MTDNHLTTYDFGNKEKLTGRELAASTRNASTLTKLCIGAAWASGEVEDHTLAQIARALAAKPKQIRAIAAVPPEQRAALTSKRRLNDSEHMTDAMLDDFIAQVGRGRVWGRLIAPPCRSRRSDADDRY